MVARAQKLTPVMIASKSLIGSERTVLSEKAVWNFATARFSSPTKRAQRRHQHVVRRPAGLSAEARGHSQ